MINVITIQDLQFGSTGKGQIAGSIAHVWYPDTVVTAWGPNAGHTFRTADRKHVTTMLASSAIAPSTESILIGPGSVLNVDKLAEEIMEAKDLLRGKHLIIHPQAAYLQAHHAVTEANTLLHIGSTMKGTSEAIKDKVSRQSFATVKGSYSAIVPRLTKAIIEAEMSLSISSRVYDRAVDISERMIIEGSQGFSLGLHTDFYPYTTSRDISTAQLLADCRIPFPNKQYSLRTIGVCRSYPIRVANRKQGDVTYSSGGHYDDQEETSWEALGLVPEFTTVTKLMRRVFTFSHQQVIESCRIMAPDSIALTFCDYLDRSEVTPIQSVAPAVQDLVNGIEGATGRPVHVLSFGPTCEHVYEQDDKNDIKKLDGTFLGMHRE